MSKISLFEFFERPQPAKDTAFNVLQTIEQLLLAYQQEHAPDLDIEVVDYAINSCVANEYMPEGTALMHVYVLLSHHTINLLITNKYARDHHPDWVQTMGRHSATSLISHADRLALPQIYSLEEHLNQHFKYKEEDGLRVNNYDNVKEVRAFMNNFEW